MELIDKILNRCELFGWYHTAGDWRIDGLQVFREVKTSSDLAKWDANALMVLGNDQWADRLRALIAQEEEVEILAEIAFNEPSIASKPSTRRI